MTEFSSIAITQEHRIAAPVDVVFDKLTNDIGSWWKHPYRLHDGEAEIRLDPRPGGALAEYWGDGCFAIWGVVTAFEPNASVVFNGQCGMDGAVYGVFSFEVEATAEGTLLKLSHRAVGEVSESNRAGYDYGWNHMLTQLKDLVEA